MREEATTTDGREGGSASPGARVIQEEIPPRTLDDLNWLRGLSALVVFVYHLRGAFFPEFALVKHTALLDVFYLMTGAGHQAVNVFFVLSGFFIGTSVIGASRKGTWSWARFAQRRFTRLYVVLVPALVLTAVLDATGIGLFGTTGIYGGHVQAPSLRQPDVTLTSSIPVFIGNLLFLQDVAVPGLGSNFPLWSLGYEFWSYVVFPLCFRAVASSLSPAPRVALFALGAVPLAFGGTRFLLYFGVWMLGALVAMFWHRLTPLFARRGVRIATGVTFLTIVTAARVNALGPTALADFLVGVVTALLLLASLARAQAGRMAGQAASATGRYSRWGESLAGFSYTLYVVHLPVVTFLQAWLVGPRQWQPSIGHVALALVLGVGVVTLFVYPLARLTEGNTEQVRRRLQQWARGFARPSQVGNG